MTRLLLATLAFYQRWLSPALHSLGPGGCRYLPTCSEYAAGAIATHGPLRGSALALWRLLRCHPLPAEGLTPSLPRLSQAISPTNHYHRTSGGPTVCLLFTIGSTLCQNFAIPIFRRRAPAAAVEAGGGDMRGTLIVSMLALVALFGYQYFFKAQTGSARAHPGSVAAPGAPGRANAGCARSACAGCRQPVGRAPASLPRLKPRPPSKTKT